jgi:hypothetical protein
MVAFERRLEALPFLYLDKMVAYTTTTFWKGEVFHKWVGCWRAMVRQRRVYEETCQAIQLRKDLFVVAFMVSVTRADMVLFIDTSRYDRLWARWRFGYAKKGIRINYRAPFNMD